LLTLFPTLLDFSSYGNSAFGIGFVIESKMSDPDCIQKSNSCGFLNSGTGGGTVKKLNLAGKTVTIRADSTSKNLTLLIGDDVVETVSLPTDPGYFGFCGWSSSKMKLVSSVYKTALSMHAKVKGTVQHFDIGFGTMDLPMTAGNIGSLGAAESIAIIGAICRVSHMSLKSQSVSGIQRLLSHDILSPLIRLSFMADSMSIRFSATKSLCSLLPYSLPSAALTALKTVIPEATSFVECLITRIGTQICCSADDSGVAPLAFTEVYQYLDILTSLFVSDSEWSRELETVLSRCVETSSLAICSKQVPETKFLIGLLTFCQNKQRLARVCPGNVIFVKESANSVVEKYIVLTYSKEGKFEEYFDVSPEYSVDKNFSLVRVHKSSIVDCFAHVSFDENQLVASNSTQTLSNAFLFCLQKMPEQILKLMMNVVSIPDEYDQRYEVLYSKSIAFGILSEFVSQYREGSYIDPSTQIDTVFYNICKCWPIFVHSIVDNAISTRMPLESQQPEKIEINSFLLLQMLINGVKREESLIEFGESSSAAGTLAVLLSEYLQNDHEYKDVKGMILTLKSLLGVNTVQSITSHRSVLSGCNQCMDFELGASNSKLTYDGSTAKRMGDVSSFPAVFVALVSRECKVTFELLEGSRESNNLTFGLCKKSFPNQSSDGFGKQSDSWGVYDNRSSGSPAWVGFSGEKISECRKFKEGDKISLSVNLDQSTFIFDLNYGEYIHKFNIPSESPDAYYFGATLANDHKIGIIESSISADHSESLGPNVQILMDPVQRMKALMKLFSSKRGIDILLPNDSSDSLATIMKLKMSEDKSKSMFKCKRGHGMVKYTGTEIAGVPENGVICSFCNLSGIELDPKKFYFCKACRVSFCVVCSEGLNGQVLCADFK
jgi:hypothetical protein